MKIGFVGAGKVGCSMGLLFQKKEITISGYYSKSITSSIYAANLTNSTSYDSLDQLIMESDLIFLTVTDQEIIPVWEKIKQTKAILNCNLAGVVHCSGIYDKKVFSDASRFKIEVGSLHPLCAVHSREDGYLNLMKSLFSIEGTPAMISLLNDLVQKLELSHVILNADSKVRYHTAAVWSSNLMLALLRMSLNMMVSCGLTHEQAFQGVLSLAEGNLENIRKVGFEKALTGPVERNDGETVKMHLLHLSDSEKMIYRILSSQNLELAQLRHPDDDFGLIKEMLNYEEHSNFNDEAKGTE